MKLMYSSNVMRHWSVRVCVCVKDVRAVRCRLEVCLLLLARSNDPFQLRLK